MASTGLKTTVAPSELAISGGQPLCTRSFPSWPQFAEDEIEAAVRVLRSGRANYWTGEEGRKFEDEFALFAGCRHATAVANGTVALELALYGFRIGPGDEVIVPSRTFIATASCVQMRGAIPVFADVDRCSGNITADTVRTLLTRRTRAIIAVHVAGWPCDIDLLLHLAKEHGLKVIEDCAQAHGARLRGRPVGSLGDAAAFSFCQDKILSTGGEGGMVTTNDEDFWRRVWSFKDHGKNYDAMHEPHQNSSFRWVHDGPGTNWRLTEMQSAIGRVLLPKIPERVARRQAYAALLSEYARECPALRVVTPPPVVHHAYYKYYVYVRPERLKSGWNRDHIAAAVRAEGVPCATGTCCEIYLEKAIPIEFRPAKRLPIARELGETSLMFLLHQTLAEEDIHNTGKALQKVMNEATA